MDLTGMLTKRGNKLKTWRRRYFELNNNNLCYYVYNGGPRKGEYIIDVNTTVTETNLRKHGFCLVQQNGRTLYMAADDENEKEMWMNSLREVIVALQAESPLFRPNNNVNNNNNNVNINNNSSNNNINDKKKSPQISTISSSTTNNNNNNNNNNNKHISLSKFEKIKEDNEEEKLKENCSIPNIHIHIIEAKDLIAKGSTNTYAKIIVNSEIVQTKVSKKDLNPIWNEVFHFPWTSDLRYARIEVWDNDPMLSARDNFLGIIFLPILMLPQNQTYPIWYKLGKRTSRSHISGEIKIMAYSDLPPDTNAVRMLREIQSIPELNFGDGNNITSSITWNKFFPETNHIDNNNNKFKDMFIGKFPTQFPPLETEVLEDISLRVSLRPIFDKSLDSSFIYVDGILLLTNYRLIFVAHKRLAYSNDSQERDDFYLPNSFDLCNLSLQYELSCEIPLATIISVTMNLQPDPTSNGQTLLDALTIRTNDAKLLCLIFHNIETTTSQIDSISPTSTKSRAREYSEPFNPHASIKFNQNIISPYQAKRRSSLIGNKLFQSPFKNPFPSKRRSQSVDVIVRDTPSQLVNSGYIKRTSIRKSSVSDELSYLEATWSREGPPCQRMLTRINNKVINRLTELQSYESIHSKLISIILHNSISTSGSSSSSLSSLEHIDKNFDNQGSFENTYDNGYNNHNNNNNNNNNNQSNNNNDNDINTVLYYQWINHLPNVCRRFLEDIIVNGWKIYDPILEFQRLGLPDNMWRITNINANYEVCSTYPALFAVPNCIEDHHVALAANFRSRGRLPVFSWRHPINHCCITRSSQPLVGLSQNRSIDDEALLDAINQTSKIFTKFSSTLSSSITSTTTTITTTTLSPPPPSLISSPSPLPISIPFQVQISNNLEKQQLLASHPLIIIDARPKINAQANQAAGKGYEIGKGYENCRVLFMGIANIHVMRKSIDMLEDLCCNTISTSGEDINWLKNIEATGWLGHINRVLAASIRIVHCIVHEQYSVLVHCSDGWDRTAQLTSLPMLMMDPYYRTFEGFMILIEKEWFSFGHKFTDRLGWSEDGWNDSERSPIFHQFLDCVHQCLNQNPNIFEFNQEMLLFLGRHILSGWFGNIFSNCEFERNISKICETSLSIWSYFDLNKKYFINPYYQPHYENVWIPNCSVKCLVIWELWFLKWSNSLWNLIWSKKNEDFSEIHDNPSEWMDDSLVQNCCDCQKSFTFIRRRHHCRACGRIFCENCVKKTMIIPNISETIPVRCCEDCINQMSLLGEIENNKNEKEKEKVFDRDTSSNNNYNNSPRKNTTIAGFFGLKNSFDEKDNNDNNIPSPSSSSSEKYRISNQSIDKIDSKSYPNNHFMFSSFNQNNDTIDNNNNDNKNNNNNTTFVKVDDNVTNTTISINNNNEMTSKNNNNNNNNNHKIITINDNKNRKYSDIYDDNSLERESEPLFANMIDNDSLEKITSYPNSKQIDSIASKLNSDQNTNNTKIRHSSLDEPITPMTNYKPFQNYVSDSSSDSTDSDHDNYRDYVINNNNNSSKDNNQRNSPKNNSPTQKIDHSPKSSSKGERVGRSKTKKQKSPQSSSPSSSQNQNNQKQKRKHKSPKTSPSRDSSHSRKPSVSPPRER